MTAGVCSSSLDDERDIEGLVVQNKDIVEAQQ